jgi:hypothetical protein
MEKDAALNIIEQIVHLKAVVGYLGEKDQFRCWDTSFLGGDGSEVPGDYFPTLCLGSGYSLRYRGGQKTS